MDGQSPVRHMVELAGDREPSCTILQQCIDDVVQAAGQVEYWLVGDSEPLSSANIMMPSMGTRPHCGSRALIRPRTAISGPDC